MSSRPPIAAIVNSSDDTTDMLRVAFEQAGFVAVAIQTPLVRDGRIDLNAFIELHRPDVVIYDIALPYETNWRLFCHLRERESMQGIPLVITTTNIRYVQPLAGTESVHEIVGKPYDLAELIRVAREAMQRRQEPPIGVVV